MSNVASVDGSAAVEFGPLVRAFGKAFGHRPGAGAALAVHLDGEPLVDIWTGATGGVPWTRDTGSIVFSATKGLTATVIHRLADRGLLDYDAPVAEYWPLFAARGKGAITVRQVMTHSAGLSSLAPLARRVEDVLDHELMESRLATAAPDRLLGVPAYHALTFGWLLAGLARAITGKSMGQLYREEISDPLGLDGPYLGLPPADSATVYAPLTGNQLGALGTPVGSNVLRRSHLLPGALGAATRCLFLPGMERILEGEQPPILRTEMGAGNGVCSASTMASVYGAVVGGPAVDGRPYLSPGTVRALGRVHTYHLDRALFYAPMMWHLGYHSLPAPGGRRGLGHIGLGGSFGWADPARRLSVGFVHNRLALPQLGADQFAAMWLVPLIVRCLRAGRRGASEVVPAAA
ncbi:beta-lactamase family protein [Nocardia puris]|nr:serine hydrolase domain-containing protein [Nocardia puris]MBF6216018.1 beta-lactamase family protein [Nocardia puris]MBF6370232.1 beta-lactamase family protein [Nocardia puris]MBF6463541.1 beta-lactamase family protein [Nocardia puris]